MTLIIKTRKYYAVLQTDSMMTNTKVWHEQYITWTIFLMQLIVFVNKLRTLSS